MITRWLVRGTGSTTGLPSGAPGRGALRCIALSPRESRCVIASRSVTLWSTVVITRWLVRGTGSTTGLPSGALGRGALHRIALYRAIAARIALHYRIAMRHVMEHRGDNPVVGSWHGINHRITIRCSRARCVALYRAVAARIALHYRIAMRHVMEHRGDNPVVGSWHWINHRITIRCSRGAARCIALRYRRAERHVMEHRGDNPVVGSWHWINHRITIRRSRGAVRCVVSRYRRANRVALSHSGASRYVAPW